MHRTKKPRNALALSLFSGAGGMDIGVEAAGFTNICAIENDPHCADTLRKNDLKRRKSVIEADIRAIDPHGLRYSLHLEPGELSLLHGGPPCQAFSAIGKQQGIADERGQLLFQMIRFAEAFRPQAVMLENVRGLLNAKGPDGTPVMEILRARFEAIGYRIESQLLTASDYGVAQSRQRVLIVSTPREVPFHFRMPSANPNPTVGEAILDLPKPATDQESETVPNHIDRTPQRDRERISYVSEGSYLAKSKAPASIRCNLKPKDTTKFRRMDRNKPALTLRCGEIFFHPLADRYLTPREYMRLHGFSDTYVLSGPIRGRTGQVPNLDQHRQVANAVPPPLAQAIAEQIMETTCQ